MGAVPGTFSRRKESQAPSPRQVHATRSREGIASTMPYPARPGECQKSARSEAMRDRGSRTAELQLGMECDEGTNDAELELGGPGYLS